MTKVSIQPITVMTRQGEWRGREFFLGGGGGGLEYKSTRHMFIWQLPKHVYK